MQVSVEEMLKSDDEQVNGGTNEKKMSFFSLAGDGDSAIVRFLHSDIKDFDVLDIHQISLGGFDRKVNCLRTPGGSKDECALCEANTYNEETRTFKYPLRRRIFIHLLKYTNPSQAEEMVWERSKGFIKKLNQLVEDYGPLYTRLYKIVRHGGAGSTDTTYDILPLDKDRYNPNEFAFNPLQLEYTKVLGSFVVMNKTNEDIKEYLNTGNFPGFKGKTESEVTPRPIQNNVEQSNTFTTTSNFTEPRPTMNNNVNPNQFTNTTAYNSFSFDNPRKRV